MGMIVFRLKGDNSLTEELLKKLNSSGKNNRVYLLQTRPNFSENAKSDLRFVILTLSSILACTFNESLVPG